MKSTILLLVTSLACFAQSTLFSMRFMEDFFYGQRYIPRNETDREANQRTKELSQLLQKDKKDGGNRVKEYFEKNWDLVKKCSFKTCPDYPDVAFCSPLYYIAVIQENIDVANWLLKKGARPLDKDAQKNETEGILKAFIKYDKKFNNKVLHEILKNNVELILKKDVYNGFKTFIDQAKGYNNSAAEKVLHVILKEHEDLLEISELKKYQKPWFAA